MRIALHYKYKTGAELARRFVSENYDARTRERAIQCLAEFGNGKADLPRLIQLLDDAQICDQFALNQFLYLPNDISVTEETPPQAPFGEQDDAPDPNARFEYRIQDVALAACMTLVGEDLEQVFRKPLVPPAYGFGRFQLATEATVEARKERLEQMKEKYKNKEAADQDLPKMSLTREQLRSGWQRHKKVSSNRSVNIRLALIIAILVGIVAYFFELHSLF